jgi:hypothetical protein
MSDLYLLPLVFALYVVTHGLTAAVARLATPAEKAK